jgi:outer membrane lipoprotein LolB
MKASFACDARGQASAMHRPAHRARAVARIAPFPRRAGFALLAPRAWQALLARPAQLTPLARFASLARLALSFLLVSVLLLLVACKTLPPARAPSADEPWEARRAALQSREHFDLTGRIAVAAAQEGFNAKLRWQQQGKQSELALDGPLGVGGVRIESNGDAIKVINSRGEQLDSESAKREIEARLGFDPPIASLRYWVLGVPDPSRPADEVLGDSKRLATLKQDGWQIEYASYADVQGEARPSKVTMTREDIRVRLVVDGWGS